MMNDLSLLVAFLASVVALLVATRWFSQKKKPRAEVAFGKLEETAVPKGWRHLGSYGQIRSVRVDADSLHAFWIDAGGTVRRRVLRG